MIKKILLSVLFLFFLSSLSYGKSHHKSFEIGPTRSKKSKATPWKKTKKISKDHPKVQSKKRTKKQRIIDEPNMEAILKRQEQKRIQQEVVAAQQRQQHVETIRRAQEFKHHELLVKNHANNRSIFQDIDIMGLLKFGHTGKNKTADALEAGFYHTLDFLSGKRVFKAMRDDG